MSHRIEKWNEVLRRHAATYVERESNRDALISVTHVELNESMSYATIYISVLPESKEEASLFFMKRQLTGLRTYIKQHAPGRVLPFLNVEIDRGEKNRQLIDRIDISQ